MGLLKSGTVFWSLVIGGLAALAAVLVALFTGFQAALVFLGMVIGMAVAGGYFIVQVLDPMGQSLKALEAGENDPSNRLAGHLPGLIMDARAGRVLSEALAGKAADSAAAAADISRAINELGAQLERQASQVEQLKSDIDLRAASDSGSSSRVAEAGAKAREAGEMSLTNKTALMDAIGNIRVIHGQSHDTLQLMEELNGKSEKIQSVTSVIEGIAAQTNLLALNAAIEAARAGDQGRGFAVVADEVRQLSARTAQATGEVAETLQAVRSDSGVIVGRIKQLADGVESGLRAVESVGERLGEIESSLEQMLDQFTGVDDAEQSSLGHLCQSVEALHEALGTSTASLNALAASATGLMEQTEQIQNAFTSSSHAHGAG